MRLTLLISILLFSSCAFTNKALDQYALYRIDQLELLEQNTLPRISQLLSTINALPQKDSEKYKTVQSQYNKVVTDMADDLDSCTPINFVYYESAFSQVETNIRLYAMGNGAMAQGLNWTLILGLFKEELKKSEKRMVCKRYASIFKDNFLSK